MNVRKSILLFLAALLLGGVMAACANDGTDLRPVEREQIENLVDEYVRREGDVPPFEIDIVNTAGNWAQVRVSPREVSNEEPVYVYLQKQVSGVGGATPAPEATISVRDQAEVSTSSGWVIVLGPQAYYSEAELDQAGVPAALRPDTSR